MDARLVSESKLSNWSRYESDESISKRGRMRCVAVVGKAMVGFNEMAILASV